MYSESYIMVVCKHLKHRNKDLVLNQSINYYGVKNRFKIADVRTSNKTQTDVQVYENGYLYTQ